MYTCCNLWQLKIGSIVLAIITRKAQLTQRGTRDSDACVKARCERNLSSQRCFIYIPFTRTSKLPADVQQTSSKFPANVEQLADVF